MHSATPRCLPVLVILLAAILLPVHPAAGQPEAARAQAPGPAAVRQAPSVGRSPALRTSADETRRAFMDVLRAHPPAVGQVLKLDPSLMRNESYLAAYPGLREFLTEYPEIAQNAGYYLQHVQGMGGWEEFTPQQRIVSDVLGWIGGFTAFAIVLGTLVWLIRTTLDYRRWNRLSRIQADVHTKLMDRFSSNDELLAYVQTPSGRRFLESGPSPVQEAMPAMSAPLARILWSVQIGAILLVSGVGLLFVSNRTVPDAREFFFIAGCLASAVGAGFVISAGASYVLSRRLGLLDPPAAHHA